MAKKKNEYNDILVPVETIQSRIYLIHGQNVMLDRDLANLYGVKTKVLKQAVRRNLNRFPEDFMFQLSKEELEKWRSQFVTSNSADKMGLRYPPFVFTEAGISMLSSILNSERAVQVNIQIIRVFTKLRQMLLSYKDINRKVVNMEKKYDAQFQIVFKEIRQIKKPKELPHDPPRKPIGFTADFKKK